jgi:hypothetical protein
MTRDTACLAEIVSIGFHPQEVSLVSFTLHLNAFTRKQLYRRLQQAYASGSLKLVKRIHALLALAQDLSVREVAEMLALGEQTVRDGPANSPRPNDSSWPSGSKRVLKTRAIPQAVGIRR